MMRVILYVIGGLVSLFVVIAVLFPPDTPQDFINRTDAACRKEFPYDDIKMNNCKIAIMSKRLIEQEQAKMKRASDAAR